VTELAATPTSVLHERRDRGFALIAVALAALELADGPFARFVVMNVKPATVDGELVIRTTYRAAPDARYPEVRGERRGRHRGRDGEDFALSSRRSPDFHRRSWTADPIGSHCS